MSLQKFNLVGGITADGYQTVAARVQGIASFPSEMGLILNFLFCYFLYNEHKYRLRSFSFCPPFLRTALKQGYLYGLFILFGIFVVFTGNRISIVALLIAFLAKLKSEFNVRSPVAWLSMSAVSLTLLSTLVIAIINTESVYERSMELFSFKNIEVAQRVWDNIERIHQASESISQSEVKDIDNYDASWLIRLHKWCYAIKVYVTHPECYLQGIGPGALGAALDGGWLRILTETGLIGLFLFFRFFSFIYRKSLQLKWMVISFAINMIFFDAYLAYKTMSLLFLVTGYAYAQAKGDKS
jgi:hypothetical protein